MQTEDKIKEVLELVKGYAEGIRQGLISEAQGDGFNQGCADFAQKKLEAIESKLSELLTPVELSDECIKNIDDNTHFHESPDWSVRFARNVLKAAGV